MRRRIARTGALALAVLVALPAAAQVGPRVAVPGGVVEGRADGATLQFRGIPFAAPPLGPNRWRAPQPVVAWQGVRPAAAAAPACLQNDYGWNRADHVYASEDCLTLDVGTTALGGKRPVIVWIHGGSNRAGSAGGMSASSMVGRGVVMVSVQYRLGIFGFLSHRGAAAEAGGASGNYGLMDQVAALRWVRANIAKFGGDPDNVTIAGESAGSQDVGLMLTTPMARGLFAKAAMESGTPGFGLPWRPLDDALRLGDQVDAALGTNGIAALRSASANALLDADRKLHDAVLSADDYMWLRTTIDGAVIAKPPEVLLAEAPPRPVLIGSNRFELDLPGGRPARDAFIDLSFGRNADAARRRYGLAGRDPAPDPRLGSIDQQIATDATFRCPAGRMAALSGAKGAPVWRYEFDGAPGGAMTRHAIDVAYIFGEERVGGLHLQDYWLNFAKTGDPNGDGLPRWPRYTRARPDHILFAETGTATGRNLRGEICSLMEAL